MGINFEDLLAPVAGDLACGSDPVSDTTLYSQYSAIEQAASGKPPEYSGDKVVKAGVPPSWSDVQSLSSNFFTRCKDLRVAVLLTRALLNREGLPGLAEGLNLVVRLLRQYWSDLYPKLVDEDGDPEPEIRINAISELASNMFIHDLHVTPLVSSRVTGAFSYRDYRIAKGDLNPPEGEAGPEMAHIAGAFMEAEAEKLLATRAAIDTSREMIQNINGCFSEQLAEESPPDLSSLAEELKNIASLFDEFMAQRGMGVASNESSEEPADEGDDSPVAAAMSGEIRSREDVIKQIDLICQYYQRREPSSPVPLVLNRAKKLATMDFMEIMKDISPDSVASIRQLAGVIDADS